jgi:uncharacterized membrane protein
VFIVGISLLFFKPLLLITAPWIGHATWHAYKSLVPKLQNPLLKAQTE